MQKSAQPARAGSAPPPPTRFIVLSLFALEVAAIESLTCCSTPKMSWVWKHFTRGVVVTGTQTICNVKLPDGRQCGESYSATTGTQVLAKHLTNVHGLECGSAPPIKKAKSGVEAMLMPKSKLAEAHQLALVWARNSLSFALIDQPDFRMFFNVVVPSGMNRHKLAKATSELAELVMNTLKAKLKGMPVTICLDGWRHQRQALSV